MLRKGSYTPHEHFDGQHRFEHWYRDNTIYFITARCRDRYPAFESEQAKAIFWKKFDQYATQYGYVPWITSLLDNHYHSMGYLKTGTNLGPMMQKLHGSVAKLVNDTLPERRVPFFRDADHHDYFDGCLRDVLQADRTYRYIMIQPVRHRLVSDYRLYPHSRIIIEFPRAIKRAVELKAFLEEVPYARYQNRQRRFSDSG
jgi:REP element-mobilizing transposase RayT